MPLAFTAFLAVLALAPLPVPDSWKPAPDGDQLAVGDSTTPAVLSGGAHEADYEPGPGAAVWNAFHIPAYAMLSWLWCQALLPSSRSGVKLGAMAFVATVAAGTVIEWSQRWVTIRNPSLEDAALNGLGAVLGIGLFWLGRRRWRSSRT